ncbi:MAG: hypothetical protein ABIW76_05920 [Fibrobacteria bacterium]
METTKELPTRLSTHPAPARPTGGPEERAAGWLEAGFLPDPDTLVSFLVNALYLFGDEGIAAYGEPPEAVTAGLTRLGHPVSAGRIRQLRKIPGGIRAGTPVYRRSGGALPRPVSEGGSDRAVFLDGALGRGDDARILEILRAMRRTVKPGGLICFHIFDRDRAWGLAGEREVGRVRLRVGFAPETGRLTARVIGGAIGVAGSNAKEETDISASGFASIKTWNLGEIPALLRTAGLVLERAYGDWSGGSPEAGGAETGRLIVVAARPRAARRPDQRNKDQGRNSSGTGRRGRTGDSSG